MILPKEPQIMKKPEPSYVIQFNFKFLVFLFQVYLFIYLVALLLDEY